MSGHNYGQLTVDRLRAIKQKTGWSDERLAMELGWNVHYIQRWLGGAKPRCGRTDIAELYENVFGKNQKEGK